MFVDINLLVDVAILHVCETIYNLGNKIYHFIFIIKYLLILTLVVHNGFLYIFGGFNKNLELHFNDLNRYNPESSTWVNILPNGILPCARRRQICQVVNDRVFLSGGTSPINQKPSRPMMPLDYDPREQNNNDFKDHNDLHVLDLSKIFHYYYYLT